MNDTAAYYRLVMLISGNEAFSLKLANELSECDREPEAFYIKHENTCFWHYDDVRTGGAEQTICYFSHLLQENKYAAELYYGSDPDDLNNAISTLTNGRIKNVIEVIEDDITPTYELLAAADKLLARENLCILEFSYITGNYPFSIIAADKREEAKALLHELFTP